MEPIVIDAPNSFVIFSFVQIITMPKIRQVMKIAGRPNMYKYDNNIAPKDSILSPITFIQEQLYQKREKPYLSFFTLIANVSGIAITTAAPAWIKLKGTEPAAAATS